jgi:hypothetical protein
MPDEKQLEKKQKTDSERLATAFSKEGKDEKKPEEMAEVIEKIDKKSGKKEGAPTSKKWLAFLLIGLFGILGGVGCILAIFLLPKETLPDLEFPQIPSAVETTDKIYSDLTGLELASAEQKTAPAFCIQTPNGNDGARPHSGLTDAGVIFEAIAEAGITRFAAIYQNQTQAVIGPIRSLRTYYLEWDTPFDCVITHAGGAPDALEAVKNGYKDLTENYAYMYRGNRASRRWNNLFTTSHYLNQAAADRGWGTSNIKGFSRMTPAESRKSRIDTTVREKLNIVAATTVNTSELVPKTTHIALDYAGSPTFDVNYDYDAGSNTYKRSYGNGEIHDSYVCPTDDQGEKNPEDICSLQQISPSVVIAMIVQEHRAADNYHESIGTTGSGDAYIFQNGIAIKGTWSKPTVQDQITFTDANGAEIKLAPGQTFISAVPNYGSIAY